MQHALANDLSWLESCSNRRTEKFHSWINTEENLLFYIKIYTFYFHWKRSEKSFWNIQLNEQSATNFKAYIIWDARHYVCLCVCELSEQNPILIQLHLQFVYRLIQALKIEIHQCGLCNFFCIVLSPEFVSSISLCFFVHSFFPRKETSKSMHNTFVYVIIQKGCIEYIYNHLLTSSSVVSHRLPSYLTLFKQSIAH